MLEGSPCGDAPVTSPSWGPNYHPAATAGSVGKDTSQKSLAPLPWTHYICLWASSKNCPRENQGRDTADNCGCSALPTGVSLLCSYGDWYTRSLSYSWESISAVHDPLPSSTAASNSLPALCLVREKEGCPSQSLHVSSWLPSFGAWK